MLYLHQESDFSILFHALPIFSQIKFGDEYLLHTVMPSSLFPEIATLRGDAARVRRIAKVEQARYDTSRVGLGFVPMEPERQWFPPLSKDLGLPPPNSLIYIGYSMLGQEEGVTQGNQWKPSKTRIFGAVRNIFGSIFVQLDPSVSGEL